MTVRSQIPSDHRPTVATSVTTTGASRIPSWIFQILLTFIVVGNLGCQGDEPIVQHRVPKSRSGLEGIRAAKRPETPDGWSPGATSAMVPIRLNKKFGEESAEITVIPLPADANDWATNVNRWSAQQLGLKLDLDGLDKITKEVSVDGQTGKRVRLVDESATDGKAIIGIMVVEKDTAWFLKLMGPVKAVEQAESDFDNFVSKFSFPD